MVGVDEGGDAIGIAGGALAERIAGVHPQLFEGSDPILGGRNRCSRVSSSSLSVTGSPYG